MPIYAYRCEACDFAKDVRRAADGLSVLQKSCLQEAGDRSWFSAQRYRLVCRRFSWWHGSDGATGNSRQTRRQHLWRVV